MSNSYRLQFSFSFNLTDKDKFLNRTIWLKEIKGEDKECVILLKLLLD